MNQQCDCEKATVSVPVRGITLALDEETLAGIVGNGSPVSPIDSVKLIEGGNNQTVALPEGGTWAWLCQRVDVNFNNMGGVKVSRGFSGAGIAKGGTIVSPKAELGYAYQVVCMRVG